MRRYVLAGVAGMALASALAIDDPASAAPAHARPYLAPSWLRPAKAGLGRTRPPHPSAIRARATRPAVAFRTAPYQIVDLGTPPGLSLPIAYAVDALGDATLEYCTSPTCDLTAAQESGQTVPYVFVAATRSLVPLATFHSPNVIAYAPYAITSSGTTIVGYATVANGTAVNGETIYIYRPVIWTRPTPTTSSIAFLDSSHPGYDSAAYAVSHSGNAIVGYTTVGNQVIPVAFSLTGRTILGGVSTAYGGVFSEALGVDDAGTATGFYDYMATTFRNGQTSYLVDPFTYPSSAGIAIDESGEIVGTLTTDSPQYDYPVGLIYNPAAVPASSAVRAFLATRAQTTALAAINDDGDFVGNAMDYGTYAPSGAIFDTSYLADLLPPNAPLLPATATALNDSGDIVGQAYAADGSVHPFEMVPAPRGCMPSLHTPTCL